jgi:mRNA interferase RelE/StbE
MYEVRFSKKAEKAYKKLPGEVRVRIEQKLEYLKRTPRASRYEKTCWWG